MILIAVVATMNARWYNLYMIPNQRYSAHALKDFCLIASMEGDAMVSNFCQIIPKIESVYDSLIFVPFFLSCTSWSLTQTLMNVTRIMVASRFVITYLGLSNVDVTLGCKLIRPTIRNVSVSVEVICQFWTFFFIQWLMGGL